VAARLAPLSVAEDTAGSIRVPAAMCGIVGFRPTTGRYVSQGVMPMTPLFDQLGPHARNVSDVILFDAVVTGDRRPIAPVSLRGVRLAVARDYYFADLDSEVSRLMEDALRRLTDGGAIVVDVRIPDLADVVSRTAFPVILHDLATSIAAYLREFGASVSLEQVFSEAGSDIKGTLAATKGAVPTDADYRTLVSVTRPMLQASLASAFKSSGAQALVFPTTPLPPVPVTQAPMITVRGNQVQFDVFFGRNVVPGSTAGLPGLVLPAGLTSDGLPVGIEFDGPAQSDRALLALGLSLERALGPIPPPKTDAG
jgi:mandelamide amidase